MQIEGSLHSRGGGASRARASWPRLAAAVAILLHGIGCLPAAILEETVFFDLPEELAPNPIPSPTPELAALPGYPEDPARLTLVARLYLPDPAIHGDGPYPTVLVLHGSGGLWSNDVIANGLISQFEQWGELLADLGYAALFPDSFNPRGIPGNFESKRPHWDPDIDDALCSPNYERPKDVVAALAYLAGRAEVDRDRLALMGFSHGAQTGINAVLDASVDLGQYAVSYVDRVPIPNTDPVQYQNVNTTRNVPSPVRIPLELPFPKLCAFYYGGGSHFGYHGTASSTAAGRYMFDRRSKVLMFHGTADSLLGVNNPNATPMTGNLYPIKQALASRAQAQALGLPDPVQHHHLLHEVGHSFDLATLALPQDWDTPQESPDQKAKRLCREEVVKWLEFLLKPAPSVTISLDGLNPAQVTLRFPSNTRLRYGWRNSPDLVTWSELDPEFDGNGGMVEKNAPLQPGKAFFRVGYLPIPPPFDAPENNGFFKFYQDFSL